MGCIGVYVMKELPTYTNETREKRAAEDMDIEENTLLRSAWDKATYQVVTVKDTHVVTDDGETHLFTRLQDSIENNQVEILGTRATN